MKQMLRILVTLLVFTLSISPVFGGSTQEATVEGGAPVTVTVGTYHAGTDSMPTYFETAVGKQILDEINVKVQVIGKPAEGYQALMSDLAANSLPDVMVFWASGDVFNTMVKAANEGMLAPMSGAIESHGPIISYGLNRDQIKSEIDELYRRPGPPKYQRPPPLLAYS